MNATRDYIITTSSQIMLLSLVCYAIRWEKVDCTPNRMLNPKVQHLRLSNLKALYEVESASLALGNFKG